jgi:hypothetical protein
MSERRVATPVFFYFAIYQNIGTDFAFNSYEFRHQEVDNECNYQSSIT